MPTRQELVLEAALQVLASGGSRPLTHRAVDTAAGLPHGSTSNLFRSRDALLGGVLQEMADRDLARIAELEGEGPSTMTREQLVVLTAEMVSFALGRGRTLTLARHAVVAEAAVQGGSVALDRATRRLWHVVGRLLRGAGSAAPQRDARWLLACVDGLITEQIRRPQRTFDARAAVRPLLAALLDP